MSVDGGKDLNLSLAEAWTSLSAPVLALAEELALRRAATERPALCLRVGSAGIEAVRSEGVRRDVLLGVPGRPQAAVHDLVQRMGRGLGPELAVSFAADQSVSQQVVLPQQPGEVLKAIVRNKVEGLAPWPLAQCLWGMRTTPVAGDPLHVTIDVAVVSRAHLADLAAALAAVGAEVKAVSIALPDGDEVEIALGGEDVRRAARRRAAQLARATAAMVVVLTCLGLLWIYRTSSQADRLEAETAETMAALKPSGALAGETLQVAAANRLYQQRRDRLSVAAVLNELSQLLPDNVYLTSLALNGDEVELKGQGSGVPDLIQILEASPDFQAVNFSAATVLDQTSNADAFALTATLEKAPPAGPSP